MDDFSNTLQAEEITLTTTQQQAHDEQLSFLTGSTAHPAGVLKGYAGVGKSTTVIKIVKTLREIIPNMKIAISAPTHKAVKVLRKTPIEGVTYSTIHSLLGLKEAYDERTGETYFTEDKSMKDQEPPLSSVNVLLLDETSQLAKAIWDRLVPYMKRGLKVLFIGDPAQIPPVKEVDAIPFIYGKQWNMLVSELTEIMRQKADNPILEFATEIRNHYLDTSYTFSPRQKTNDRGEGIILVPFNSQVETDVLKYFDSEAFNRDSDYMKVIAWRNETVDKYNKLVRSLLYRHYSHISDIMLGEKLIMDKPYIVNNRVLLTTNEEIEVVEVMERPKTVGCKDQFNIKEEHTFKVYSVKVKYILYTTGEEKYENFDIIHEDSRSSYHALINKLTQRALDAPGPMKGKLWREKFEMQQRFGWVKYNYAITGHKSQGSTYDHALVLKWDIDKNWNIVERNRILYVACSRSRHTLFIEE